MPIKKIKYEKHEGVLILIFGTGDICFTKGEYENYTEVDLIFNQAAPHEIGSEGNDYVGKHADEIPDVQMVMRFDKPESIAALIHSLVELQKKLFKNQRS